MAGGNEHKLPIKVKYAKTSSTEVGGWDPAAVAVGSPSDWSATSSFRPSPGSEGDQLGPLLGARRLTQEEVSTRTGDATPSSFGGSELSLKARIFVFVLFTQLMQALMSYDGGATQMSTQPLLQEGWSSSELGLLGAMDKFGQVATAFLWSSLLMKYNNKALLAVGLLAKASSCLGFGLLSQKWLMLGSKLGMGVSEALIGVWATVWVQANAPRDSQARWLGLASVSAGIGNGAGSAVAGLCSKRFGYSFAFVLQGAVLFGLWGIMLFTPAHFFEFMAAAANGSASPARSRASNSNAESPRRVTSEASNGPQDQFRQSSDVSIPTRPYIRIARPLFKRSSSTDPELMLQQELARSMSEQAQRTRVAASRARGAAAEGIAEGEGDSSPKEDISFTDSVRIVLRSRLWLWTAMSISLSCFITSAVAYMWQNTMGNVWQFNDQEATYSFLATTGFGGLVGVALGPKLFDEYLQGFATPETRIRCLRWCTLVTAAAVLMGTMAALLFLNTAWHLVHYEVAQQNRGWLLGLVFFGIFFVFALLNSMQGTLYGINTESTTPETKTAAAALTVSMQNVVGFSMGPLVPSLTAEMVGHLISGAWPEVEQRVVYSAQFSTGMAVSLVALWPLVLSLHLAAQDASGKFQAELAPEPVFERRPIFSQEYSDLVLEPL